MNKNDEWYTPSYIIKKVNLVFSNGLYEDGQIDLDPASNHIANQWIKAKKIYNKEDNGLLFDWKVDNLFINPPYSAALIGKFLKKLKYEYESGNIGQFVCLTNQGTDTQWNQNLVDYLQAFTIGRISFVDEKGNVQKTGSRGQCFTYAGPNIESFIRQFNDRKDFYVCNSNYITLTL